MEYIDVVTQNDKVIGKVSRSEIYSKRLPHRIVHVMIFNNKGEMALQLRTRSVSFAPHHWSTPAGGHVQSGETYEQAVMREMNEELGIQVPVEMMYKDTYRETKSENITKFLVTFHANYNGKLKPDPQDVEKVAFFSPSVIHQMTQQGEKFHPELLFLLEKHYYTK